MTQGSVLENSRKKGRRCDQRNDGGCGTESRGQGHVTISIAATLLIDSMNGTVEKPVSNAVGGLTSELHNRMRLWEGQMETQLKSQIQQHWDIFEEKWEDNIVQLEPGSKEGAGAMACAKRYGENMAGSHGEGGKDHDEERRDTELTSSTIE